MYFFKLIFFRGVSWNETSTPLSLSSFIFSFLSFRKTLENFRWYKLILAWTTCWLNTNITYNIYFAWCCYSIIVCCFFSPISELSIFYSSEFVCAYLLYKLLGIHPLWKERINAALSKPWFNVLGFHCPIKSYSNTTSNVIDWKCFPRDVLFFNYVFSLCKNCRMGKNSNV